MDSSPSDDHIKYSFQAAINAFCQLHYTEEGEPLNYDLK